MAVEQTKFLIRGIDHLARWEAPDKTNKIILFGIRREQDRIRNVWVENIHEILRPYHITPYLTTQENPFVTIGEADKYRSRSACQLGDVVL